MSEIVDLGEHEIVPVNLPQDQPPIVLADVPRPGSYTMLMNDELEEGEDTADPDHFERHGGQVLLLDLAERSVRQVEVRSGFYEKLTASRELGAQLEELLGDYEPEVVRLAVTDCKTLMGVV